MGTGRKQGRYGKRKSREGGEFRVTRSDTSGNPCCSCFRKRYRVHGPERRNFYSALSLITHRRIQGTCFPPCSCRFYKSKIKKNPILHRRRSRAALRYFISASSDQHRSLPGPGTTISPARAINGDSTPSPATAAGLRVANLNPRELRAGEWVPGPEKRAATQPSSTMRSINSARGALFAEPGC